MRYSKNHLLGVQSPKKLRKQQRREQKRMLEAPLYPEFTRPVKKPWWAR